METKDKADSNGLVKNCVKSHNALMDKNARTQHNSNSRKPEFDDCTPSIGSSIDHNDGQIVSTMEWSMVFVKVPL